MRGDIEMFPDPPVIEEVGINRRVFQALEVLDVQTYPSWFTEEVRNILLDIPGVEKTSSFCEHVPDWAVGCKQVCTHLLAEIAILELVSFRLEVFGDNPGPYGNVRCFVRVILFRRRLKPFACTNRP